MFGGKEFGDKIKNIIKDVEGKVKEVEERMKEMDIRLPSPSTLSSRSNVVASRIGDEELGVVDMLTEAGLFSTRSEAVAYLVAEGIKARKDIIDKVTLSLKEIRRVRREAEEHIARLKREIGFVEPENGEGQQGRKCLKCGKELAKLPEDIAVCPYCGLKLKGQ